MRRVQLFGVVCALGAFITPDAVHAGAVNTRPVAVSGTSLQDALNAITVSGPGIDVLADQAPFARFTNTASGGSVASFAIELASFSGSNEFGIYDSVTGTKAMVFDGAATAGGQSIISFMADGSIRVNFQEVAPAGTFISPTNFGFYVDVYEADSDPSSLDHTVYSEDSLNAGNSAGALVFQGDNATQLQMPGYAPGTFTDDEFIIAFDDGLGAALAGAADYSDLVVLVESIAPVPAPGALLLGAMGLGMVNWVRRRTDAS